MAKTQRERLTLLAAGRTQMKSSALESHDLLASVRAGGPVTAELQDRFQQLYHRYSWASTFRLWSIIEMCETRRDRRSQKK